MTRSDLDDPKKDKKTRKNGFLVSTESVQVFAQLSPIEYWCSGVRHDNLSGVSRGEKDNEYATPVSSPDISVVFVCNIYIADYRSGLVFLTVITITLNDLRL